MSRTSIPAAVGAVALLTVLVVSPAAADDYGGDGPATLTYPLPGEGVFPEGIDTFGRFFYVTSAANGTVFRGRIGDTDSAEEFLPGGEDGRTSALGIEATDDLLLVAGGETGTVFVYDRRSGLLVSSHKTPGEGATRLNDIAVTPNGDVYVTDSSADVVYRIDEDDVEDTTELETFAVLGDRDPVGDFNANGIVSARDGRYLIVVETDSGRLYRLSTRDAAIDEIDLGGATVLNGDGLEIKDRTLYVVHNVPGAGGALVGVVTKLRLGDRFTSGRILGDTTDDTFRFPSTAALDRGRLLVVNSQLDQFREGGAPVEPFTVSSIPRP